MKFSVVITCAGTGSRFQSIKNKVLVPLQGKPMYLHSVDLFREFSDDIIIVVHEQDQAEFQPLEHVKIVLGGNTRQKSVSCGVMQAKYPYVFVHDGARPYLTKEDVLALVEQCTMNQVVYLGRSVVNTIRFKSKPHEILDRSDLVEAYTPQCFPKEEYLKCLHLANQDGFQGTDEIQLFQKYKTLPIIMVEGRSENKKVTTKEDLAITEHFRIGHSWDIHQLVENRKLILGGVEIPYEKGLLGHSDADVVLHAISEAMLGALALGDIGKFYPDNDPKYKDIDSKILLKDVFQKVCAYGYDMNNLDVMVYAEKPKLAPYIEDMRTSISTVLGIHRDKISVKATTYEKLGDIGAGRAIASECTLLLVLRK